MALSAGRFPSWYSFRALDDIPGNAVLREGLSQISDASDLARNMALVIGTDRAAKKAAIRTCLRTFYANLQNRLDRESIALRLLGPDGEPREHLILEANPDTGLVFSGLGPGPASVPHKAATSGGRLVAHNFSTFWDQTFAFLREEIAELAEARESVPIRRFLVLDVGSPVTPDSNRLLRALRHTLNDSPTARDRSFVIALVDRLDEIDHYVRQTVRDGTTRRLELQIPGEEDLIRWLRSYVPGGEAALPDILLAYIAHESIQRPDAISHAFASLQWVVEKMDTEILA
jgi:hypothetical protein